MKVRILGSGTSQGIPVIGCKCRVCLSSNEKDKRLRSSIIIEENDTSILIDIGPDFRQQMLSNDIRKISTILITHEHNDHIAGLDDVRPFNYMSKSAMPIYALERVAMDLKMKFSYIFGNSNYPGLPSVELNIITSNDKFVIDELEVESIGIMHGNLPILGYKLNDLVYLTDIKSISPKELEKVKGCDTLIISCLRKTLHHSHLSLGEALDLIDEISPSRTYLTHISHDFDLHHEINLLLPENVFVAFDGMELVL